MVFEERMVTHEKWLKSFSWQMTLRLGLSEPPCVSVIQILYHRIQSGPNVPILNKHDKIVYSCPELRLQGVREKVNKIIFLRNSLVS